jgi:hypothetical protein
MTISYKSKNSGHICVSSGIVTDQFNNPIEQTEQEKMQGCIEGIVDAELTDAFEKQIVSMLKNHHRGIDDDWVKIEINVKFLDKTRVFQMGIVNTPNFLKSMEYPESK